LPLSALIYLLALSEYSVCHYVLLFIYCQLSVATSMRTFALNVDVTWSVLCGLTCLLTVKKTI
jgi:hypothetical protein